MTMGEKIAKAAELARQGWRAVAIAEMASISVYQAKEIIKRVRG